MEQGTADALREFAHYLQTVVGVGRQLFEGCEFINAHHRDLIAIEKTNGRLPFVESANRSFASDGEVEVNWTRTYLVPDRPDSPETPAPLALGNAPSRDWPNGWGDVSATVNVNFRQWQKMWRSATDALKKIDQSIFAETSLPLSRRTVVRVGVVEQRLVYWTFERRWHRPIPVADAFCVPSLVAAFRAGLTIPDDWRDRLNELEDICRMARAAADFGVASDDGETQSKANGDLSGSGTETSMESRAVMLLRENPTMTDKQIAKTIGVSRTSLYRYDLFKKAKEALREGKADLPRGYRDCDGRIDAFDGSA